MRELHRRPAGPCVFGTPGRGGRNFPGASGPAGRTAEKVAHRARELVRNGVDIISPACGLSTSTALGNVAAMTAAVKEG